MRSILGLVTIGLALAACSPKAETASSASPKAATAASASKGASTDSEVHNKIVQIEAAAKKCRSKTEGDADAMPDCQAEMIEGLQHLAPKATKQDLDEYLADLADEVRWIRTDGSPGQIDVVADLDTLSEFARDRILLLLGEAQSDGAPDAAAKLERKFAAIEKKQNRGQDQAFGPPWIKIRDADCRAYPVNDCARRLDTLLLETVTKLEKVD